MADDSGPNVRYHGIPWWEIDDTEEAAAAMVAVAMDLRSRDESRRTAIRIWDDIYDGRTVALLGGQDAFGLGGRGAYDVPVYNVTRNIVDFVHAKVTADVPTVVAESHDGDHREERRAVKLSRFVHGTMEAGDCLGALADVVRGGLRTGTGCLKVVVRDGGIRYEGTSPRELLVDPDDARHRDPRVLYQVKPVDRHALMQQFPDDADAIKAATGTPDPLIGGLADPWSLTPTNPGDALDLFEAWVLPRFGDGGRRILAIQGRVLEDVPWEDPRFPIALLRPMDPRDGGGMWGQGFVERLIALQYTINEEVAGITKSQRLTGLRVFLSDGSDIAEEQLEDPAIGNVIRTSGAPGSVPTFFAPPGASEQRIRWVQNLIDWAYTQFGMSETAASSQRNPGINSGRAMLVEHDITTLRHVDLAKRLGALAVDVVERTIDAARRLAAEDPEWAVRCPGAGGPRALRWSDVDMDRDRYVLSLEQASATPDTFAGHVQMVEQDVSEGRIPGDYLLQLRQDPDIERRWDTQTKDGEFVDWVVDELVDPTNAMPPVPDEAPKALLIDRLRAEVLDAIMKRAEPAVLDRLQRYSAELVRSTAPPPGPPQAPGQGPQAPLGGPPGPTPGATPPAGPGLPQTPPGPPGPPGAFTGGIGQTTPGT